MDFPDLKKGLPIWSQASVVGMLGLLWWSLGVTQPLHSATTDLSTHPHTNLHGKDLDSLLEGYALLQELANEEGRVDQVLIIRDVPPTMKILLKDISDDAQDLRKDLELFRKDDPSLHFGPMGLPDLELATRKAITKETTGRILGGKQAEFELEMLLNQAAALSYGENLLSVVAQHDDIAERRTVLLQHSATWKKLRQRVCDLFHS